VPGSAGRRLGQNQDRRLPWNCGFSGFFAETSIALIDLLVLGFEPNAEPNQGPTAGHDIDT
jgi:hypothetical protein